MKKIKFLSFFVALTLVFAACSNVNDGPDGPDDGNGDTEQEADGTEASPYTVADAIKNQGKSAWVEAYIVGNVDGEGKSISTESKFEAPFTIKTNVLIAASADVTDPAKCMAVQLPIGDIRNGLNLVDKETNLGKKVKLYGLLEAYFLQPGLKSTSYYEIEGGTSGGTKPGGGSETGSGNGTEASPYDIEAAIANQGMKDNTDYKYVTGFIVGIWEGKDADGKDLYPNNFAKFEAPFYTDVNILLAGSKDVTNTANLLCVQLPAGAVRTALNLVGNANTMLGAEVTLCGTLDNYNSMKGMKNTCYYKLADGTSGGTKPVDTSNAIFEETLLTQASYDKFTVVNVSGALTWKFDAKYGAVMTGYDDVDKKTYANEDWFISPAIDLAGKSDVTLTFDHARGPAGSMSVSTDNYTLWISNNYASGAPSVATWAQLTIPTYGTTAWGFVSSGNITIPTDNLAANARIAFKYVCNDTESATWEMKNIVVK